jgi:EmrB/QacA subfamily drug resistance transporter
MIRTQTVDEERVYERRWWAFSVLALAILIVVIDHTILNVALPTIQRELGATVSDLQWIVDAYILTFAMLLLTMGTLSDRIGRATMLRAGMAIFGIASLAAVFASSAWQLVLARVFMGVGAAMILPATLAIITNIFPNEERGKAIGIWGAMNGVGVALGPLLGGILIEHFNWSAVFFINVPIVATALMAGQFLVPNSYDPMPRRLDVPGTILSALTLSVLVFSLIKGSDWGWTHPAVIGSFASAIVLGAMFILWEKKVTAPMLNLQLFRNLRLSIGASGIAIMAVTMFGVLFALTMYMQFVKNYSALETGIRFLPIAFGYAFGSVLSNRFVKLWGTKYVVVAGFLGMAVSAVVIAFWHIDTPYWQIGVLLFALSFCLGNIMTPCLNAVLGAVPAARAGVGSAISTVSLQLGGALGVAALGSALSSVYRTKMEYMLTTIHSIPIQLSDAVAESVGSVVRIIGMLPESIRGYIALLARQSFMDGWQVVLLIIGTIGLAGAILTLKFMPRRGEKQEKE